MFFQVSDSEGRNFFELLDNDLNPLEPSSIKEGPWLQHFGYSNSLCTHSSRAIMNYALIGKYQLYFFLNKEFGCLYSNYPIETRQYILHECKRFNNY